MTSQGTNKIFNSFSKLNVLIIGDVMIDSYVWGKVTRISPEAPVPVVSVSKKENRLGGGANVALNVKAMGAVPILCSVIGNDVESDMFLELLKEEKLSQKGILRSSGRITTVKTRVIGNNHQLIRVDEEMESDISASETEQLLLRISHLINSEHINVIIFEDYDKGLITPTLIDKVVKEARKKKIPVVVDPKRKNFMHYKNVSLFKPNLKELKEGLKIDFDHHDKKQLQKAVDLLQKKLNAEITLVTLSELGLYISTNNFRKVIPAHARDIMDVSGAGDTVVSVAALCLALKLQPEVIAKITNLAGGLVCEKVGVVPIDKKQLLHECIALADKKELWFMPE